MRQQTSALPGVCAIRRLADSGIECLAMVREVHAVRTVPRALSKGLVSLMHPAMLALSLLPLMLAGLLWGAVIWAFWEPAVNAIQHSLSNSGVAAWVQGLVVRIGLDHWSWRWQNFVAPILMAWMLVPLVALSVVIFIGFGAAPIVVNRVARAYPELQALGNSGVVASLANMLRIVAIFIVLWVVTWPLWLLPPLGAIVPALLWGWLNYRIMIFDVLARHATRDERRQIMQSRRYSLMGLGVLIALLGAIPTSLWLGGAALFILQPLVAIASLWLYVVVFMYSALVFAHYGLETLRQQRLQQTGSVGPTGNPAS